MNSRTSQWPPWPTDELRNQEDSAWEFGPHSEHSGTPQSRPGSNAPYLRLWVHIASLSATNLILWFLSLKVWVWGRLVIQQVELIFSILTYLHRSYMCWPHTLPSVIPGAALPIKHLLSVLVPWRSFCSAPIVTTWKYGNPLSNCRTLVINIQVIPFNAWPVLETFVK